MTGQIITQGARLPLKYTKKARHRILCGINWDPMLTDQSSIGDKIASSMTAENRVTYDLDLACVLYDAEGNPLDGVSSRPDEAIDQSGMVYHSGDDESGIGDLDDEFISIELKDLPDDIAHIIFVVEVQSSHSFGEVSNPTLRLADAFDNEDQIEVKLDRKRGADKTSYVFANIYRHEGDWMLHFIDDYYDGAKVEDWLETLKKYLG